MTQVRIGTASHIADRNGTHEPGEVIDFPTQALVDLATAGTLDPATGEPYCEIVGAPAKTSSKKADAPETETA